MNLAMRNSTQSESPREDRYLQIHYGLVRLNQELSRMREMISALSTPPGGVSKQTPVETDQSQAVPSFVELYRELPENLGKTAAEMEEMRNFFQELLLCGE